MPNLFFCTCEAAYVRACHSELKENKIAVGGLDPIPWANRAGDPTIGPLKDLSFLQTNSLFIFGIHLDPGLRHTTNSGLDSLVFSDCTISTN